jgi:Ciliary BBSome complex subunit 2, middle region
MSTRTTVLHCTALTALLQDFEVRLFREEETLLEITEADAVTHLCTMTSALTSAPQGDAPAELSRTGSFSGSASMYSAANSGNNGSSSGSSGAVTSSRGKWGYALADGTVGVYEKSKRVWRVKNKHQVYICLYTYEYKLILFVSALLLISLVLLLLLDASSVLVRVALELLPLPWPLPLLLILS